MSELVSKLRRLREFHDYSQAAVAYCLNIAPTTYGDMERGATRISIERLNQIAIFYELSLSDFINKSATELIIQVTHVAHSNKRKKREN